MSSVIVLSAPSGTGKTTLLKALLSKRSDLVFSVSHTTRKKRQGEVDGVDYHYVSEEIFQDLIEKNFFIEWAIYGDFHYGTSWEEVEKSKEGFKKLIIEVDIQGFLNLKKTKLEATYIFISPPSLEILEKRLRARGTESEAQIQKRLETAKKEMIYRNSFDHVIINDDFEKALKELDNLVDK